MRIHFKIKIGTNVKPSSTHAAHHFPIPFCTSHLKISIRSDKKKHIDDVNNHSVFLSIASSTSISFNCHCMAKMTNIDHNLMDHLKFYDVFFYTIRIVAMRKTNWPKQHTHTHEPCVCCFFASKFCLLWICLPVNDSKIFIIAHMDQGHTLL